MNPLAKIWIFIIILIGLLSLESWQSLYIYGFIFLSIFLVYRGVIWPRIKGFIFFLPIMFFIYSAISVGILGNSLYTVFAQAGFITLKFGWMILVMAFYLEWGSSATIILALRAIWMKTNKRWEKVENGFLFLALIFRFYPSFQLEWQQYTQSDMALGISPGKSLRKRIKRMIDYLPGMIFAQYQRADDISQLMVIRGYGKVIPRTVARPINWTWQDSSIFIVFPMLFVSFHFVATI